MSHEVETMAYAGQTPWHGLGTKVDADISIDEMLVKAGLDWEVSLEPLYTKRDGGFVPVPGKRALTRSTDGRVLTIAGANWKPMQNKETLEFMRSYVESGGAMLETAGSLQDGKTVWALARLNHDFSVMRGGMDKVRGYLLFSSPHEMGRAIDVRTTAVRVVCQNTMSAALRSGAMASYRQSHTEEFNADAARENIAKAHEELSAAEQRYRKLARARMTIETAITQVFAPVLWPELPPLDLLVEDQQPKQLAEIIDCINFGPGADTNSAWGMLNGYTHWADHVAGYKPSARLFRSWFGSVSKDKVSIEEKLMELIA